MQLRILLSDYIVQEEKVALISLKSIFFQEILSGRKKFEFRKIKIRPEVTKIFIYVCNPVKLIHGFIKIDGFLYDKPDSIWEQTKQNAGIPEQDFFEYCNGNKYIYAYKIREFIQTKPLNPFQMPEKFTAPQSIIYF